MPKPLTDLLLLFFIFHGTICAMFAADRIEKAADAASESVADEKGKKPKRDYSTSPWWIKVLFAYGIAFTIVILGVIPTVSMILMLWRQ